MITYQQLKDFDPQSFADAADDWLKLAKEAEASAEHLYERDGKALAENWADEVGEKARQTIRKVAQDFQAAGMSMRGVLSTLDGYADAIALCKRNLDSAVDFAVRSGLTVDADGQVTVPAGAEDQQLAERAQQSTALIADAVRDAAEIDKEAAASLARLIEPASITKVLTQEELRDEVLNKSVRDATASTLEMIKETMPLDAGPQEQAAWWSSLTKEQQDQYMKAAPVELHDMKGIPDSVRKDLIGNDGLNRVEMLRWVAEHGDTTHKDVPGMSNCTNFVSHAMRDGGGLPEEGDGQGWKNPDDWYTNRGEPGDRPYLPNNKDHSEPWAAAQNHHDYMLKHGGETVPVEQAKPGDIVYFKDKESIHHAAVVTAVMPDGEVVYTQHTPSLSSLGLNDRVPHNDIAIGSDVPIIVRPHPDWV
ncbi:amidase domain-containing protein [Actinokineospora iranica]|uniref:Putative amidase domain-containing protein n=1 Tax=Actinokineospora iranica TaxID=1271860 RepID=A0A1G6UBF7_9PSEU|nr:amidase domain-containing protein [Actinokineospora iranica]SDD38589.1 Putative amidase domain-containing protein [Actinokineospora iranica]